MPAAGLTPASATALGAATATAKAPAPTAVARAEPQHGLVRRHRRGVVTLGTAALLWGAGAVTTPAPGLLAAGLALVAGLGLVAGSSFGAQRLASRGLWRGADSGGGRRMQPPGPTLTAVGCYGASAALVVLFLTGIFRVDPSVTLGPAPDRAAATALAPASLASPPAGPAAAAAQLDSLRVLSLNVWHGYPETADHEERYLRLRDLVRDAGADVILLQEAWSTRGFGRLVERLAGDLDLGYAYARANGSLRFLGFEEGLAILSPHPVEEARRLALGPRLPAWEMRAALGASIALPGGEPLEVWNTHLSHGREAARNGQARSLAAALAASRPALLGGDFNAGLDSAALGAFQGLALSPLVSDRIDHLLATPALLDRWVPVNVETLRFGANAPASAVSRPLVSDHPALFVELGRRPGGAW